jgi:hypothetical protein
MDLHIGDMVELELQDNGRPRWSGSIDYGGTGKWARGKVIDVRDSYAVVRFDSELWHVPLSGHSDYSYWQWQRPGFLRRGG